MYIWSLNLASTYFEIYVPVIVYMRHWPIAYGQRAKTMQEFIISQVQIISTEVLWRFRTSLIVNKYHILVLSNIYTYVLNQQTQSG